MNYTLTVTQQEMLVIMQTIAQLPYAQIAGLMQKLGSQVDEQDKANAITVSEL